MKGQIEKLVIFCVLTFLYDKAIAQNCKKNLLYINFRYIDKYEAIESYTLFS